MDNPTHKDFVTARDAKRVPKIYFGEVHRAMVLGQMYDSFTDTEYALIALEYTERYRQLFEDKK